MNGIDTRDFFAGMAMAGFLANAVTRNNKPEALAKDAYVYADAMLQVKHPGKDHFERIDP